MTVTDSDIDPSVVIFKKELVNIYGAKIKANTSIGPFVEIQNNSLIGKNCKISSHSFICNGVIIEDEVFIGHGVIFTNDLYPRSTDNNGNKLNFGDWKLLKTIVKKRVSIGSNSTILCGIEIGENSIIGAGSTVTKNINPNSIYAGNPAAFIRKIKVD